MTCFVFIRHGETDQTGAVLSGRTPGIHLNQKGQAQAEALPKRLELLPPKLVCTSPLERTRQTAEPLAHAHGLEARVLSELMELDYGDWSGETPAGLEKNDHWREYNQFRSLRRIPAGELLVEAQIRMLRAVELLREEVRDATVAVVSHGDPIKAIVAYLLGLPLDFVNRLTVAPASLSIATVGAGEPRLHCMNLCGPLTDTRGLSEN